MKDIPKRRIIYVWAIIIILVLFYLSGYFYINGGKTNLEYTDHHIPLNDGWSVTVNGATTENATLPFDVATKQHETVVLTRTLPENIPNDSGIVMRNYHQLLDVKIDGKDVYSYPNKDWLGVANIISDEWCLVPLGPNDSGKTIEVSLTNSAIFKFTAVVGDFYYGSDNSLVQYIRGIGFPKVIMGIIITIIAGLLLIVSYIYRNHTNQSQNTAMGVSLMGFGIWLINRAKMCIFPVHSIYAYWGSLMMLLLVAPFAFLYSYFRNSEFKKTALWGFRICITADLVLVVSSIFIKYDVEVIVMFAYGLTVLALALNAYSLFLGGFGAPSKKKSNIDKLLDRTEFLSNWIIPITAVFELSMYSNLLWTEASMYMCTGIMIYAIVYMIFVLWRTFLVVQDRTIVTQQLHDSRLELMMGQIQPHFIFNTLSSIRTLVMVEPQLAYNMLYDFSNYLRANVDNVTNMEGIRFASEVEHIKSYVNIEKVRFGDRLNVEYDIESDDFVVPPLSIQPLIENAIKHGVCKRMEGGTVYLRSYDTSEYNVIEVADTGVGFNQDTANHVFYAATSKDKDRHASHISANVVNEVLTSLDLIDKDGNKIVLSKPEETLENFSGNGSESRKSTGMLNILLRLKEMANAKVEIHSVEGSGTTVRVLLPKSRIL